jgi:lysyl-tRNA synthetase class 1
VLDTLLQARTWPVKLARQILNRTGPFILEMGYGPSGLPHLGTATEVIRTVIVAETLRNLTDQIVVVIAFCDDLDGMRKIPPNIPNQELLKNYLGCPISAVPDPYGNSRSFAESNIQKLVEFVRTFGYETVDYVPNPYSKETLIDLGKNGDIVIIRSSDCYKMGVFDNELLLVLKNYREILNLILPTLGKERSLTYSPFMPISKKNGAVLESGVTGYYPETGEIQYIDQDEEIRAKVDGTMCKLQWKIDFGMRWKHFGVDFEMSGKDIEIGTNPIARSVCEILGGDVPITWMYEMFLAADGSKMSKTKGNGVSVEEMLRYMPVPAIRHYMFLSPEKAKILDITKIPKYVDDFLHNTQKYDGDMENPIHYTKSEPARIGAVMTLHLILGLNLETPEDIIEHLEQTVGSLTGLDKDVVKCMYLFYHEHYKKPEFIELNSKLKARLALCIPHISADASNMQTQLYNLGNDAVADGEVSDLKEWFHSIYQAILGQEEGRRLGNFFAMCGPVRARELVERACGTT